jgi:hypothetical protein
MTGAEENASDTDVDALELELRRLPDVVGVAASFDNDTKEMAITLSVASPARAAAVWRSALDLAPRYFNGPVRVEVAAFAAEHEAEDASAVSADGSRGRVRLISVDHTPDASAVVVRLGHGQRESAGSSVATPLVGAVRAALAALESLGAYLPFEIHSVTKLGIDSAAPVMVSLRATDGTGRRFGVVADSNEDLGATKATLHALNRHLELVMREVAFADAS